MQTRFPPEPNGYLHIGHAKAITVDFGIAEEFGGICNLRFDDTNPDTEDTEYVDSHRRRHRAGSGFHPGEPALRLATTSSQLYEWAEYLIERRPGLRRRLRTARPSPPQRGGFGKPGVESPYRDRSVEENLDLFRRMRAGEFPDGARVLRAKIDMQHENMQLRDPVMYRIRHGHHHRTRDAWCIYPTYDWAHGQSDAIEGVTHSLCTLEFDSHRPLYDWYLEQLPLPGDQPRQIEFARLELTHTVTSKRRLAQARRRRHRRRLGRPAHAHPARPAPPRLPGRGDPRRSAPSSASTRTNSRQSIEAAGVVRPHASSTAPPSAAWPCCARCGW